MITVRPATAADIPPITRIYRPAVEAGTASFELSPPDEAEMGRRFATLTGSGYPYLVAEEGGQMLGYAYAGAYRTRPAYRFTVENSIYVDPVAQGKGVGRVLLDRLIQDCTERGFRLMVAVIGDSANFSSITLHRRCGFRFSGTLHSIGWKHGRWLDSVLMELPLGEGDGAKPHDAQLPLPLQLP
jgi:phosphinothricin acetyltransferase